MMGSDMNDLEVLGIASSQRMSACRSHARRRWLAHCTALAAMACALTALPARGQAPARSPARTILVVGDSLSAEYGLERGSGWVALLSARLGQRKSPWTVVNASISGDTSSGGLSRLPALLVQHRPAIVIIELGGNDALRGLALDMTRANLAAMARAATTGGARVAIVGMQVPPNYGRKYSDEFAGLFATVAKAEGAALVPFLLKGVADSPQADAMFQADRIHPKAVAHALMLDNVWPTLEPMLR
jgi:acyl-CoA thioesterase-1